MPEPSTAVTATELQALLRLAGRLEAERDQARALAAEMQEWLDVALRALGVETVFDIPGWRERAAH